jgi:hypothetical protein
MFQTLTFLSYATSAPVVGPVCLIIGVTFGQPIKDWLFNVHPELRRSMRSVERRARHDIEAATADILSKLPTEIEPEAKQLADAVATIVGDKPAVDA